MRWPTREKWAEWGALLGNGFLVNKRFREAISRMTPEEFPGWLARGADPNTDAKPGGWCPLARAARSPFTDNALVEALLAAGAQASRLGGQLLWVAHSSTDRKMCLLMEAGADVTVTCPLYHRSVVSQLIPWAYQGGQSWSRFFWRGVPTKKQ